MLKITDKKVTNTLDRLHKKASGEFPQILKGLSKGIFRKLKPEDMKDVFISITQEQGEFVYDLLRKRKSRNIVEFGTSFGISTLYLGAAARENGGKVITAEILEEKCMVAQQHFEEAGLSEYIELREGNALETLKNVPDEIDFLLLDGWSDLYIPLLQFLEPKFKQGAMIYTDNISMGGAKSFMNYVRSNPKKFKTQRVQTSGGRAELTEYLA